jgi:hypothetical protein
LIYTNLTNGNEILGIILAMLYYLIPFACICIIAWILSAIFEEVAYRLEMRKERRK